VASIHFIIKTTDVKIMYITGKFPIREDKRILTVIRSSRLWMLTLGTYPSSACVTCQAKHILADP
jgi:uncharacterized protein (UPF0548 family)